MLGKQVNNEEITSKSRKRSFLNYKTIEIDLVTSNKNLTSSWRKNILFNEQHLQKEKTVFANNRRIINSRLIPQKEEVDSLILSDRNRRWMREDLISLNKTTKYNQHKPTSTTNPKTIFQLQDLHIRGNKKYKYLPFLRGKLNTKKKKQKKNSRKSIALNEALTKQQPSTQQSSCIVNDEIATSNCDNECNGRDIELIQKAVLRNSNRKCELWLNKYF